MHLTKLTTTRGMHQWGLSGKISPTFHNSKLGLQKKKKRGIKREIMATNLSLHCGGREEKKLRLQGQNLRTPVGTPWKIAERGKDQMRNLARNTKKR